MDPSSEAFRQLQQENAWLKQDKDELLLQANEGLRAASGQIIDGMRKRILQLEVAAPPTHLGQHRGLPLDTIARHLDDCGDCRASAKGKGCGETPAVQRQAGGVLGANEAPGTAFDMEDASLIRRLSCKSTNEPADSQ